MLHFLGPAHLTLVYFLSYSVFLSVLIHWKLCLWEIVTLWVKLSGVRLREGRVRKWRARERVREIEDGVALLKDMAETVCLHSGPAGSGSFDLVWPGFSIPSSLSRSLFPICVDVGCYFTQSAQTRPCSLHIRARYTPFGTSCIPFFHLPLLLLSLTIFTCT